MFSRSVVKISQFGKVSKRTFCQPLALQSLKAKSVVDRKNTFIDWRPITVVGGDGGRGCIAFLHLLSNDKAGPDGGDGGNGGHVLLIADPNTNYLNDVSARAIQAWDGQPGLGKSCTGANGEHVVVPVPLGTVVSSEDGKTIADLDTPGIQFLAARGGAGGKGNKFFLSDQNRHPRVCQNGARGEIRKYILEMKAMAHAGMVGFPNAGKSTLLQAISRAKPKIASYPFTTLRPHIGMIEFDDYEQIAVADLPGIIEGAHKNIGLGIDFLKHAERCSCLLYVVDISVANFDQQLHVLRNELECYKPGFSNRISIIVANKIDLIDRQTLDDRLRQLSNEWAMPIVPMSAKFGSNVSAFMKYLRKSYDDAKAKLPASVVDTFVDIK